MHRSQVFVSFVFFLRSSLFIFQQHIRCVFGGRPCITNTVVHCFALYCIALHCLLCFYINPLHTKDVYRTWPNYRRLMSYMYYKFMTFQLVSHVPVLYTYTKKKLVMYCLYHNFKTTKCRHMKFSLLK